jgi:TetR/AcrR family transcriptional regulator, cholesterol catabolism regulator
VDGARARKDESIVHAVLELIESQGYDAVQLRTVAERSRVSLRTIYKYFSTRDALIVAALERWMAANAYRGLDDHPSFASLYDALMWGLRRVFEPWERSPRMLHAFHRARTAPGGERLRDQGFAALRPVTEGLLADRDEGYAQDVELVLTLVALAAIAMFADGDIAATDILGLLERAVFRLTTSGDATGAAQYQELRARR